MELNNSRSCPSSSTGTHLSGGLKRLVISVRQRRLSGVRKITSGRGVNARLVVSWARSIVLATSDGSVFKKLIAAHLMLRWTELPKVARAHLPIRRVCTTRTQTKSIARPIASRFSFILHHDTLTVPSFTVAPPHRQLVASAMAALRTLLSGPFLSPRVPLNNCPRPRAPFRIPHIL